MPIPLRIENCTRVLGKPEDWKNDNCFSLHIRDVITPDGPFMVSAWELTQKEMLELALGHSLKIWIMGKNHPVIGITVGEINELS